jgi:predicted TPR repeat methyltransferase
LNEARRLHRSGDWQSAEVLYRSVLRTDPDRIEALHGLGVVGLRLGKLDVALAFLGRAIQVAPAVGELYSAYGDAWLAAGEPEQAAAALARAASLRPARPQSHAALGAAQSRAGRFLDAVASFRQALALGLGPDSADVHYQLAHALLRAGPDGRHAEDAATAAREALRLRPEFAEAWHVLGEAMGRLGQPADAVAGFRKAVELRPDAAAPWQGLGSALSLAGDFDAAERAYRQAMKLAPDCFDAVRGLAIACARNQKSTEAIELLKRAALLRPRDAAVRGDLAIALENAGRAGEAVAEYEQLLQLRPGDTEAQFHLAALSGRPAPPAAPPARVAALFDRYAESFDQHLVGTLGYRTPQLLFDAVSAAGARSGARALDLGCGTGLCGPLFRPLAAKLTGVDISSAMIAKARDSGQYDTLEVRDLLSALNESPSAFDLLIAADVFVYLGDLAAVHKAAFGALSPGGLFAYSVESFDGPGLYELRPTRRYAHSAQYLADLADCCGFKRVSIAGAPLRAEHGQKIDGYIVVLSKP